MSTQTAKSPSNTAADFSNSPTHDRHLALLRRKDVEQRTALSRSRIYDLMAKGEFPKPARLGSMSIAWASDEIDDWIAHRLAQREVAK